MDKQQSTDLIKNSIDVHVHSAPSLFERELTAKETVDVCRQAGMAGLVLKAHHGSSVEVVAELNSLYSDIDIYGGLVMNYFTGGLNARAAEAAIELGAGIIWLPTIHAAAHKEAFGVLGGFPFQKSSVTEPGGGGIYLLDDKGELKEEVLDILDAVSGSKTVLATGHISYKEISALSKHIKENKPAIKLLVSHCFFKTPGLTLENIESIGADNVWFEVSNFSRINGSDINIIASAITKSPELRWVLSSDSGQKGKPVSPQALLSFAGALAEKGVSYGALERMLKKEPSQLLD